MKRRRFSAGSKRKRKKLEKNFFRGVDGKLKSGKLLTHLNDEEFERTMSQSSKRSLTIWWNSLLYLKSEIKYNSCYIPL